jgi:hypothetical protein
MAAKGSKLEVLQKILERTNENVKIEELNNKFY